MRENGRLEMRAAAADSGSNNGMKEEEEEEESLSLCDLPINEQNQSRKESSVPKSAIESQEDFNFFDHVISKESEMCVADEVFFQGQIVPLRHSVSCDGGFSRMQSNIRNASTCISRSDSMDHSYSGGLTSASSRSSSINSHHSSSSGSSSATTTTATNSKHNKPRPPRVRNQFQYSHPSPKPQIRSSSIKNGNSANSNRNSGLWSLFRVGLMTPPEIAIQDLKNRSNSNKNSTQSFGSRNSTSSNISISSNSSKTISAKRKQPFFFNKNGVLFGGCKCTVSSVGPNPSRITVDRSSSAGGSPKEAADAHEEKQHAMKMTKHQQAGKQALSRHRTFEWLKQLSLEAAMDQM